MITGNIVCILYAKCWGCQFQQCPGPGDEGVVIGYLDRPSVIIQRSDGSQSSWSIDLDYEELGTDG